jgi:hypothetical protein
MTRSQASAAVPADAELTASGVAQPTQEPSFLRDPAQDALLDALVALTAELWVERDRRMLLEKLLAARGILEADALEQFRPSESDGRERGAARDALVRRILSAFRDLPPPA